MKAISRLNDSITGITSGEHNGHFPAHGSCTISGNINGNCSDFVFIENIPVAIVGSTTIESDCCDSGRSGSVSSGSPLFFIENISVARVDDTINPHNGTARISQGNNFIFSE